MMKTINHKGKTLHYHAASGFYIDLDAHWAFYKMIVDFVDENKDVFQEWLKKPLEVKVPVIRERCLVLRTNKTIRPETCPWDGSESYAYSYLSGGYWAINVEIEWKGNQFGQDIGQVQYVIGQKWRNMVGKRHSYALPWAGLVNCAEKDKAFFDFFPMSACYSPARIALENMQ